MSSGTGESRERHKTMLFTHCRMSSISAFCSIIPSRPPSPTSPLLVMVTANDSTEDQSSLSGQSAAPIKKYFTRTLVTSPVRSGWKSGMRSGPKGCCACALVWGMMAWKGPSHKLPPLCFSTLTF